MQISITGLSWSLTGIISLILSLQMLQGTRAHGSPLLRRFGGFFLILSLAFFSFATSLVTDNAAALRIASIAGLEFLIVGAIIMADASWIMRWKKFIPRWFFPVALVGGGITLAYLLLAESPQPEVATFGIFTVVQWDFSIASFLASTLFPLIGFFLVGSAIIQRAKGLAGPARKRGLALGYTFIFAPAFGYFTAAPFLSPLLLMILTTGELFVFFILLYAVLVYRPSEKIREQLEGPARQPESRTPPRPHDHKRSLR